MILGPATEALLDPASIPLGQDPDRHEIDGVPVFHLPLPGSTTMAMLTFGTGQVDEPIRHRGITHLAEHLVMGDVGDYALDGNGMTGPFTVSFALAGTPAEIADFFARVCRSISDPPIARAREELTVLATERDHQGGLGIAGLLTWLRVGYTGLGQLALPEYFLRSPHPTPLRSWIQTYLVTGNCAAWVAGTLPENLRFELPVGTRNERPPLRPISGLETPTFTYEKMDGVGAGFLVPRTVATLVAFQIAHRRLRRVLRLERSLGYHVDLGWLPVSADDAIASLWATCQPNRVAEVEGLLLTVLDELAMRGPTEEELLLDYGRWRRHSSEPMTVTRRLDAAVDDHLFGAAPATLGDRDAAHAALDAEAVRAAMHTALESMILAVPPQGFEPNRRSFRYPGPTDVAIAGPHRIRARHERKRPWDARPALPELHVGPTGIAVVAPNGTRQRAVAWADCAAVVKEPEGVRVIGADGHSVLVAVNDWEGGQTTVNLVSLHAPAELLVPLGD